MLFAFTETRPRWRVPELTEHLGLNKSTLYRLLHALQSAGLVRRDDDTATYSLGPAVLDLAGTFLSNVDLSGNARPSLRALAERSGETVNLAVLDGTDAIRVDIVRGTRSPQLVSHYGLRIPFYCSAAGKALVLDHTPSQLQALFDQVRIDARTEHTLVDAGAYIADIERSRQRGWTLNDEESEVGMRVVGAPVRDFTGAIVASVSVSAPRFRLNDTELQRLAEQVRSAATEISGALGGAVRRLEQAF